MTDSSSKKVMTQMQAMMTDQYLQGGAGMLVKLMENAETNAERAQAIDYGSVFAGRGRDAREADGECGD